MIVYVIEHSPDGDSAVKYEGMGVGVISGLLTERGLTGTVVTKEEYDAFVAAHAPPLH